VWSLGVVGGLAVREVWPPDAAAVKEVVAASSVEARSVREEGRCRIICV